MDPSDFPFEFSDPDRPPGEGGGDDPGAAAWARGVPAGDFAGQPLFEGGSPRAVLRRLRNGDPLDLRRRCLLRLRHHAILADGRRLHEDALARIAFAGRDYRGEPDLGTWIEAEIDFALRRLVEEDLEAEVSGVPPAGTWDPAFGFVSDALGVEPPLARRCAVIFNGLPHCVRRAFCALVLQGKSMNRHATESETAPERCEARLRYALGMMSSLGEWKGEHPDPGAPLWVRESFYE